MFRIKHSATNQKGRRYQAILGRRFRLHRPEPSLSRGRSRPFIVFDRATIATTKSIDPHTTTHMQGHFWQQDVVAIYEIFMMSVDLYCCPLVNSGKGNLEDDR